MNLQHVNVKLLLANPAEVHLDPLIPVFHSWIQDKVFDELLLDIADYQHVPDGPGVVLIGFEGDYSVDNTDHRLGVRYNRKTPLDGTNQDRLKQAARAALTAASASKPTRASTENFASAARKSKSSSTTAFSLPITTPPAKMLNPN